jgi:hypothetical protein
LCPRPSGKTHPIERLGAIVELANERRKEMTEKEEAIGYYTEDGDIYCVECINKDSKMMEKIEKAITAEDSEKSLYFCDGCKKEIK